MNVLKQCAERIVKEYFIFNGDALIICDKPHMDLAYSIKDIYDNIHNINCMIIDSEQSTDEAFKYSISKNIATAVLAEPNTFSNFRVFNWLDFRFGPPKVANLNNISYISVLPIDSTYRVYSSNYIDDKKAANSLLSLLKANTDYKAITDNGTSLNFTSRNWIYIGTEVLTAPIEKSINGVIAVDGSFFYRSISTTIDFYIKNGMLDKIKARNDRDNRLIEEYNKMTENDFRTQKNMQLAEIGIGSITNATISECFMESEMKYGTCHFCFGNNECYGGNNKSDFHGASVLIKNPHFIEC